MNVADFFSRYKDELLEVTQRKVKRSGLMIQTPGQIFDQVVFAVQEECHHADEGFLRNAFNRMLKQIIIYWLNIEDKV